MDETDGATFLTPRRWTDWNGSGPQMAWVIVAADQTFLGLQGALSDGPAAGAWRVTCGADGTTDQAQVNRADGQMLHAQRGPKGWLINQVLRPDLQHCTDADLSASPATNMLPIRRLGPHLGIGEQAEITALFLDADAMEVRPARQRYTRLGAHHWRYEGLQTGFTAELHVDHEGWVLDYPGIFRRVRPGKGG